MYTLLITNLSFVRINTQTCRFNVYLIFSFFLVLFNIQRLSFEGSREFISVEKNKS